MTRGWLVDCGGRVDEKNEDTMGFWWLCDLCLHHTVADDLHECHNHHDRRCCCCALERWRCATRSGRWWDYLLVGRRRRSHVWRRKRCGRVRRLSAWSQAGDVVRFVDSTQRLTRCQFHRRRGSVERCRGQRTEAAEGDGDGEKQGRGGHGERSEHSSDVRVVGVLLCSKFTR